MFDFMVDIAGEAAKHPPEVPEEKAEESAGKS
jgi:hypothetical protein